MIDERAFYDFLLLPQKGHLNTRIIQPQLSWLFEASLLRYLFLDQVFNVWVSHSVQKNLFRNFISSLNVFSMPSLPLNSSGLLGSRNFSLLFVIVLVPFMRTVYSRSLTYFLFVSVQIGFRIYQSVLRCFLLHGD